MVKKIPFILLCIICLQFKKSVGQINTTIVKRAYAGSYLCVPNGYVWEIEKAFINGGDYNFKVNNSNFKNIYKSGDTIRFPYYISEMELLSEKSMVQYELYFKVKNN